MADEQTFRVAIVGCGWAGSRYDERPADGTRFSHAGAYADFPRTTVVAVCDADPGRATECARFWDIASAYSDLSAMLREATPDLVSVCTPDATHAAVIRACLECKSVKGLLAEKPLAMNLDDALDV